MKTIYEGAEFNFTQRNAIARRQLHASVGAVVAVTLLAGAAFATMRVSNAPTQVADAQTARIVAAQAYQHRVVRAAVRQVPSQTMQATDQRKVDRGS